MKERSYLFIACILCSFFLKGQGYEKSLEYTPSTPIASEILRHGLTPVNQYTGIPQIMVPVHTMEFDGMEIPINLQYHAGGIRTNQEATWAGLGWSLSSQAVITRQINQSSDIGNGIGDIRFLGYCYQPEIPTGGVDNAYLNTLRTNVTDTQPDIFTASLFGETVKFQLTKKAPNGKIETIVLNESKALVAYDEVNRGFIIVNDRGFTFEFMSKEYVTNLHGTEGGNGTAQRKPHDYFRMDSDFDPDGLYSAGRDREIITSWFVDSITSPNGKTLKFSYYGDESLQDPDPLNDILYLSLSTTIVTEARTLVICNSSGNAVPATTGLTPDYSYMRSIQENKYLKEIVDESTGERVVFKLGDRDDIKGLVFNENGANQAAGLYGRTDYYRTPKKLNAIEVFAATGKKITQASLFHSYFNQHRLGDELQDNHLRLKLDGVSIDKAHYAFTYEQPNLLPEKTTTASDFWGFYNGNQSDDPNQPAYRYPTQELSPQYLYGLCDQSNINPFGYFWQGGNLGSSLDYGKIGTLKKMTYPTGASTSFLYESNTVVVNTDPSLANIDGQTAMNLEHNIMDTEANPLISTSNPFLKTYKVGGLRIASVENRDRDDELLLKKNYRYHGFSNSSVPMSSGKLMSGLAHYYAVEGYDTDFVTNSVTALVVSSGNAVYGNNSAMGNHMGYTYVEETIVDAKDVAKNNGRIVTEFINRPNQQLNSTHRNQIAFNAPSTIFEEGNGRVKRQEIFDNTFSSIPRRTIENIYITENVDGTNALKVYYSHMRFLLLRSGVSGAYSVPYDWFPYWTRRNYSLLSSSTVTDNLENGTSFETKTFNTHNSLPQLTSTKTINSKGDEVRSEYYYPYDTYLGLANRPRMDDLVDENRIASPVYTRNFYNGSLLNHQLTSFDYKNGNLRPSSISFQKADAPFQDMEVRVEFDEYDDYGNPTKFRRDAGPWTRLVWGYENMYPIAEISNVDESAASIASIIEESVIMDSNSSPTNIKAEVDKIRNHPDYGQSQINSYTFGPMIGMVESSDIRRYSTTYGYDDRERLTSIRDEDNALLEDYRYNLTFETDDCLDDCPQELTLSTSAYKLNRNQGFTISHGTSSGFNTARWEVWYGDGNVQTGTGTPSNLSYSYSGSEPYGLKPIRLFLYDSNGNFITGNTNVRLYDN